MPNHERLLAGLAAAALLAAGPARAADDALSLLPPETAGVAQLHLRDLKASPLTREMFAGFDELVTRGGSGRFLDDAGFKPLEDADSLTIGALPHGEKDKERALLVLEGRFDAARFSGALAARGAKPRDSAGARYFLLPPQRVDGEGRTADRSSALAFLGDRFLLLGEEPEIVSALAQRASGGAGAGPLGRELHRISAGATCWALLDMRRLPVPGRDTYAGQRAGKAGAELLGTMRHITWVAVETTVAADRISLAVEGLSEDDQTRRDLEDSLRGLLAAWRVASAGKLPELIPVLRGWTVKRSAEGVRMEGSLPASLLEKLRAP